MPVCQYSRLWPDLLDHETKGDTAAAARNTDQDKSMDDTGS